MIRPAVAIVLLFACANAFAQAPRPVRPYVFIANAGNPVQVQLEQDACFAWSVPSVARAGNVFTVTQDVSPRSPACSGGPGSRTVTLEAVPTGLYRLVYRATATGMPAIPPYSLEFSVNPLETPATGRGLRVYPVRPTALEPIVVRFNLTEGCEIVTGVRPVDGGFAIRIRRIASGVGCDADEYVAVALGSYAPGPYSLALVRDEDGSEITRTSFSVTPETLGVVRTAWADLSGLWTATDEEPNTALAFIHTLDRGTDGLLRDALVGIWYTYDETGAPAWYYIEANTDGAGFGVRMTGTISRYRSTNPAAPTFQRVAVGAPVGTIQLRLFNQNNPDTITGTLNGRPFDIRIERFRWTRSAWPPPRNASP